MFRRFYSSFIRHEAGFVLSTEALLLGTTVVLGLLVGLVSVRDSFVMEFEDFSNAIGFLNQSYSYTGAVTGGGTATTQGGLFGDTFDGDDETAIDLSFPENPEGT